MARQPTTPWPTTPGSVFFSDAASDATLSRATKDGRIRRLVRGLYSADVRAEPAELVARNRWKIVARLVPDALIADRSAAEGGLRAGGVLTIVSNERKEDLVLPGLVIAPRTGPGPLDDDLRWAEGLRLSSDARILVDNLAVSRGRSGRLARTLSRSEVEDWVVRTAQRRPDGWLVSLRARALELCDELGCLIDATRWPTSSAPQPAHARPAPARAVCSQPRRRDASTTRTGSLASTSSPPTCALSPEADVPVDLPALAGEEQTSLPFFEAYFSNFIEGTEFSVEEAEAIVASGEIPEERPEDAHDVLGTFEAVHDPELRAATPGTIEELLRTTRATAPARDGRPARQATGPVQGAAEPGRLVHLRGARPRRGNAGRRLPACSPTCRLASHGPRSNCS